MRRTAKARSRSSSVRGRRAERIRSDIVRAGLKVFAAKGFTVATMDDIALELDATKGLLYYHFKTKEEILAAILRQSPMVVALEGNLQTASDVPLRSQIRTAIEGALALLEANRDFVRFLHVQSMLSAKEAEVVYHEVIDRLAKRTEEAIEHSKSSGQIRREINSRQWARMAMSLVTSYFLDLQVFETRRKPDPEYLEHLIDTITNAIATNPEQR